MRKPKQSRRSTKASTPIQQHKDTASPSNAPPGPGRVEAHDQAEANFATLIESTDDFIWAVDLSYRLIVFNKALRQNIWITLGVRLEAGMRLHELLPPERAALWPQFFERAMHEGPFQVEDRLILPRILELAFNHIVIDGKTVGISVFGKDITERKAAEEAYREADRKYRDIFDKAIEGFYQTTPQGKYLTANPALAVMLGFNSADDLVSAIKDASHDMWVDPDERARFAQQLEVQGELQGYECQFKRKDNSVIWVSLNVRRVLDAEGRPLRHEGFIQDITARRRAEMQLRDSEERYRSTFEQAVVGIVHSSFDGRLLRGNAQFAHMLGYAPEELRGLTIRQLTAPEDLPATVDAIQRILSGAVASETLEKRHLRKDGSLTWSRMTVSAQRDGQGRPLHLLALVEDINARKSAEARWAGSIAAMQVTEARYKAVFQTSPDAVMISRLDDGFILDANQAFMDSSGYDRDEVTGRKSLELGIWANPSDRLTLVELVRRNGGVRDWEALSKRKNGETFWMRLSATSIEIEGSRCLFTFARDISESKAAEERLALAQEALRASEERYRVAFQTSLDGVSISCLGDGRFIDANNALLQITGFEREELIGRTSKELNFWVDQEHRDQLLAKLAGDSSFRDFVTQFRKKDGDLIWVQISASVIQIEGVCCILSLVRDISGARAAEECLAATQEALRESEARYRTAFQMSHNAVNINRLDDGMYFDVNKSFLDIMGYERDEVVGKTSLELEIWADKSDRARMVETLVRDGIFRSEEQFRKKNGEIFWGRMSASLFEHAGVACVLSVTQDISDAKAAQDEIRTLAFYDPLTSLPNRRLLEDRLRQSLSASSRHRYKQALLFVDLDHFKNLNDTLGHQTGDLLLQEVATRLRLCVRETDTVARLGGDEFLIILEELSQIPEDAAAKAETVAKKILASLEQPYWLDGRQCLSSASVGITVFGDHRETLNDVMQHADIAMYQAKAAGRNTFRLFAPALQTAVVARATLEDELRRGIKANEFVLFYQPQVDCNCLIGAEALLRWNHSRRGLLSPDEFISLTEETGLIVPLGNWVLETACARIAAWEKRGQGTSISINISARQFREPKFVQEVVSAIDRTGASPHRLTLELTESLLLDDAEETIGKMQALKLLGVRLSLDDFGTGYSSLSYLKRLPLDQLKIDRSFVRDLMMDICGGAIVQAVISLGRAMGLSVVAEGVETEDQRDCLAKLGCHAYQGNLFSRPLPVEEFQRLWLGTA